MTHRGFSHIGLSTLDLDKTREFYEGVLGFKPVVADNASAVRSTVIWAGTGWYVPAHARGLSPIIPPIERSRPPWTGAPNE